MRNLLLTMLLMIMAVCMNAQTTAYSLASDSTGYYIIVQVSNNNNDTIVTRAEAIRFKKKEDAIPIVTRLIGEIQDAKQSLASTYAKREKNERELNSILSTLNGEKPTTENDELERLRRENAALRSKVEKKE